MSKRFPYKDSFFDSVIAIQVIDHNTHKGFQKTVREIRRVLKKNGILFITTQSRQSRAGKKHRIIGKHTYIPLDGGEKGLVHHYLTIKRVYKEFKDFRIRDVRMDKNKQICILGMKK